MRALLQRIDPQQSAGNIGGAFMILVVLMVCEQTPQDRHGSFGQAPPLTFQPRLERAFIDVQPAREFTSYEFSRGGQRGYVLAQRQSVEHRRVGFDGHWIKLDFVGIRDDGHLGRAQRLSKPRQTLAQAAAGLFFGAAAPQ